MKKILVATCAPDMHATSVLVALRQFGRTACLWFPNDMPQLLRATLGVDPSNITMTDGDGQVIDISSFETFWHRRIGVPVVSESLLEVDRNLSARESKKFLDSIIMAIEDECVCVNPPSAARAAEDKSRQLRTATACGWEVPQTVITNDPVAIRELITASSSPVIIKPFRQIFYKTKEGKQEAMFTSTVTAADLPDDWTLSQCPAIYQTKVEKAFELRIHCLGAHVCAVKINSQEVYGAKLDWRAVPPSQLEFTEFELSPTWKKLCIDVVHKLGLVFGCIDAIVTKDGELVFLEVNQMGQFLWIEAFNPRIHLLDRFARFLCEPTKDFQYEPDTAAIRYETVAKEAWAMAEKHRETHVPRPLDDVYFRE